MTAHTIQTGITHGVHSEVGRLRKVLVCAPGLAHERLTPTNSDDLLFDDVLWVESAQRDHLDFVNKLTDRGVEVVELRALLAETMAIPEARSWLLDRKVVANRVGLGLVEGTRAYLDSQVWWGDPEQDWGQATLEGGDVMPVGNSVVLVGMSERTSRQAITQLAKALFDAGAATQVIVASMPRLRAAMHLDTVFTFADRDLVVVHPAIVDGIHAFTLRPGDRAPGIEITDEGDTPFVDVVARAMGLPKLRVVETAGDVYASERQQWDSANNAVALE